MAFENCGDVSDDNVVCPPAGRRRRRPGGKKNVWTVVRSSVVTPWNPQIKKLPTNKQTSKPHNRHTLHNEPHTLGMLNVSVPRKTSSPSSVALSQQWRRVYSPPRDDLSSGPCERLCNYIYLNRGQILTMAVGQGLLHSPASRRESQKHVCLFWVYSSGLK